jgi:DNA primase small subunit
MIDKREFGFVLFEGMMLRHKSFQSGDELKDFLKNSVPSNAYCSCAYYENPEADMEKKGWLGADLIFDIDADHIPTPCNKVHDEWICSNCGSAGNGVVPEMCSVCGGEKFDVKTWPCEVCLNSAKFETQKLLDALTGDFGFSKDKIRMFFSGHRGYHVQVESDDARTLDAIGRKEIVDYVCSLGIDVALHSLGEKEFGMAHIMKGSSLNDFGWRRRIAKGMYNFILNATKEDFMRIGLKRKVIETILDNRNAILENWKNSGSWGFVKGIDFPTWMKIAEHSAKLQSAKIDTVVTTDIHRLIRLADTLHGKTGLKKVEFPVSAIDDFDPFKSAIAFKENTATVFVSSAPEFRLGDEIFGPYKNQKVELPSAAAALLICKGRAEVVD